MSKKDYKIIAEALADIIKKSNGKFTEEDAEHLIACFYPYLKADNYRFSVERFKAYLMICLGKLPVMNGKS